MGNPGVEDELREIREAAARVARERYAPKAAQWDLDRTAFPHEERRFLGELGYLGIALPEEYGGSGAPLSHALAVIEEFAKVCRPAAFQIFESNTGPAQVVALMGTEHQKKTFLPGSSPARSRWPSPFPSPMQAPLQPT